MHDDPGTWRSAFIARRMRHVGRTEDLFARAHDDTPFQVVAVINGAFALEQIGDGLDALMIVGFGPRAVRHRHDVHANLFGTHGFGGGAGAVSDALLADISLTRLDDRDP